MNKYKTVDDFLEHLSQDKKAQVLELSDYIRSVDSSLDEHIKWNAPSYSKDGEDE